MLLLTGVGPVTAIARTEDLMERDLSAVVGGPVGESLGQDAGSRHFRSFVLPKKGRLLPVPSDEFDIPINCPYATG